MSCAAMQYAGGAIGIAHAWEAPRLLPAFNPAHIHAPSCKRGNRHA